MKLAGLVFCIVLSLSGTPSVAAQSPCDLSHAAGVASVRADKTYLAVWQNTDLAETLSIYAGLQCAQSKRVGQFKNSGVSWQSLTAIEDFAIVGFRIRTTAPDSWYGATKIFMYDGNSFVNAFESENDSEVIDLDGDGYPEVVEFLHDSRTPNTRAQIWVWNEKKFVPITTVPTKELFSPPIFALLAKHSRWLTRRNR